MDAVQNIIFKQWQKTIAEIEDHQIDDASAHFLIDETRQTLRDAGVGPVNEHLVMQNLRDQLPMLTGGHPICRQFITLLTNQLEAN